MTVFCLRSSWKVKKKKDVQAQESSCNVFFASDGPWPLQIILHNTCSLFSTSDFSFGVKKKRRRRRKETENVLSCLSLRFSLTHCGLFALMGAEPGKRWQWKPKVNAHWTATVSVSVHVVHRLTRPHLQPPAVSFPVTFFFFLFYCSCSVIFQPSCKFLKLFTATEVLQILYNSVNVL